MTARFRVSYGELKSTKSGQRKIIDKSCLADFWKVIKSGNRHGVYVFGVKAARGWKPLYVGQAKKQTFKKRIGQHMQVGGDFDEMLRRTKKGTPVLFLIGRVGKGNLSNKIIDEIETEFINYAFARNKNLHNDRKIKKPTYVIEGFGSRGKPANQVVSLKAMVGY